MQGIEKNGALFSSFNLQSILIIYHKLRNIVLICEKVGLLTFHPDASPSNLRPMIKQPPSVEVKGYN